MRKSIATYPEIRAPRWGKEESEYELAKKHPEYVFGVGANNALVHKIRCVRLRWWTTSPSGAYLVRLQSPQMFAECICGATKSIDSPKAKVCELPAPNAVLCARCMGTGRNFPRNKPHDVPLREAKVRLGCADFARETQP